MLTLARYRQCKHGRKYLLNVRLIQIKFMVFQSAIRIDGTSFQQMKNQQVKRFYCLSTPVLTGLMKRSSNLEFSYLTVILQPLWNSGVPFLHLCATRLSNSIQPNSIKNRFSFRNLMPWSGLQFAYISLEEVRFILLILGQ